MEENEFNLRLLLAEKLKAYFEDENIEIQGMMNTFSDLMLRYVDCNYQNLIEALDRFIQGREKGLSQEILTGRSSFDVSVDNSELKVKTFFHKDFPAIYFYRNGEETSFFKMKQEKKEGAYIFKARYKSGEDSESKNFERCSEEYMFKDGVSVYNRTHIKNADIINGRSHNVFPALTEEQLEFYDLLQVILKSNNIKVSNELSNEGKEIIFNDLYLKAKEAVGFSEELRLNEVFRILVETIYQKNRLSNVSEKINNNGGDFSKFYANNGMPLNINITNSGEHITLDASAEDGRTVVKYNIFRTTEGFTIYRNYSGQMREEEKQFSTLTINLSNNLLKFSVLGKTKAINSPIEFMIKFNDDGKINFNANENVIFFGDNNPLERKQKEIEEMY